MKALREFKHFERQFGPFVALAVCGLQFESQRCDAVAEFGVLQRECGFIDRARQVEVEQAFLLATHFIKLTLNVAGACPALLMVVRRAGDQGRAEPVADRLGLFELGQHVDDLLFDLFFTQPNARMAGRGVSSAAIVHILLPRLFLGNNLSRDGATAMAAEDQLPGVGQFVGLVDLVAKQFLNPREGRWIDDRIVSARHPPTVVLHVADVRPVPQDAMDFAAYPVWLLGRVRSGLDIHLLDDAIERAVVVGVLMEDAIDVFRFTWLDLDDTAAVYPFGAVTIRRNGRKPPVTDSARQALFHIDG